MPSPSLYLYQEAVLTRQYAVAIRLVARYGLRKRNPIPEPLPGLHALKMQPLAVHDCRHGSWLRIRLTNMLQASKQLFSTQPRMQCPGA